MIRSEIRAEAMRQLSEQSTTASYILPADHNAFIDEGIKDMCYRGFVYLQTKTGTILTTIARYFCPTDFIRCLALLNPSNVPLTEIPSGEVGTHYIIAGKPLWYYLSQQSGVWYFTLIDTPTTAGGGTGTYTIVYNALDIPLAADGSSPNFPPEKHYALVKYDLYLSFVKMKKIDLATAAYLEYCKLAGIPIQPEVKNG
jgi:hypothetical protein